MNKLNLIGADKKSALFNQPVTGTLILSYTVDLIFLEQILIRRFMKLGSSNNLLLADQKQVNQSEEDQLPHLQPDRYDYLIQKLSFTNLFHSKAIWLNKKNETQLLIGSGNIGYGGMSSNSELFAVFSSKNKQDRKVMHQFAGYTEELLYKSGAEPYIFGKRNRLFDKKWLKEPVDISGKSTLLHNLTDPIFYQMAEIIDQPEKIHVIAPFYDKDLTFIKNLAEYYQLPVNTYFQEDYTTFPRKHDFDFIKSFSFHNESLGSGNLHAKMIIFERSDSFDILFGSPNATKPAMLKDAQTGNGELAVVISDVSKDRLGDYLPVEKKPAKIAENSFSFSKSSYASLFLINSAHFNFNNFLVIDTSKNLDIDSVKAIITQTEEFNLPHDRVKFKEKSIEIHWPYQTKIPNWVYLKLNEGISNKILVFNYQKAESSIDSRTSKTLNSLNDSLLEEPMLNLEYVFSVLPSFKISSQTRTIETQLSERPEKKLKEEEEVEATIEKEVKDYYVKISEINLSDDTRVKIHHENWTLNSLLKIFKKFAESKQSVSFFKNDNLDKKSSSEGDKATAVHGRHEVGTGDKVIDHTSFFQDYYQKFLKDVDYLSAIGSRIDLDEKSDAEFFKFAEIAFYKLSLFLYLTPGFQISQKSGKKRSIKLESKQISKLSLPVIKLIRVWWALAKNHKHLFTKKDEHLFICRMWVFSVFAVNLLHSAYRKYRTKQDSINYHIYGHELLNAIRLLLSAI